MDENELGEPKQEPGIGRDTQDGNINISDVIEVIETDAQQSSMFNGGGEVPGAAQAQAGSQNAPQNPRRQAYVKIIEQPASKALRFRYECEGRSAGSIPGVTSTPENRTFPTIKIFGYTGRAVVVVSCVTKDAPYRPHPHSLVGREGCRRGVCTLEVSPETMTVTFSNLGIQCVKKKDIEGALRIREDIRVDPFRTGYGHRNQPTSIDLNAVRLCFQVFLEGDQGKFTVPLTPVVSEIIFDKKAMSDLVIVKLSDCVCPVDGGRRDLILLCEKVAKEDIQIRFYEENEGQVVWEGFGDFQPSQVHKQTGIWFRPPRYRTLEVTEPVRVSIQLRRPSDGASSEPLPFEFLPLDSDYGKRKRQKFESNPTHVLRRLSDQERSVATPGFNIVNIPIDPLKTDAVKTEPRDTTSPYQGQAYAGGSMYTSNSSMVPQYIMPLEGMDSTLPPPEITYPMQFPQNIQQVDWNLASTSTVQNDFDNANGISNLLNMDSQQLVPQFNLDSQELAPYRIDPNNLSETFSSVSLSDVAAVTQDQNMTDSFTRLANSTIDKICQLNQMTDMFKSPNNKQ